jgi:hypothetical protein
VFGLAVATNEAGNVVWIVSASELKTIAERIAADTHRSLHSTTDAWATDRGYAQIRQSEKWLGTATSDFASIVGDGQRVELIPRLVPGAIQLTVGFHSWFHEPVSRTGLTMITNRPVCCSMTVSNRGAVIFSAFGPDDGRTTNYFLLISPIAKDKNGADMDP